ncbi:hypothetical protein F511_38332 [Dorcoceras hygrometricum]|uniref:Uncharacterized protein n=1 Tax=Dorcoceras hygrometricum TaxID=472368 RepID=A0A2Z7BNJ3_9LAMI|nr:hypothetical protein F511_38332 [Dorcoceras hygrometricum]
MVNGDESSCQKYGVPLYGAAWAPLAVWDSDSIDTSKVKGHVVLAGGGGEGRSGIANALLVSAFDVDSNSLSDQPVAKLGTGCDLPYRIAVHPGGEGVICSLPKSCRWFEWEENTSDDKHGLSLKSSEKVLQQLEDVGQQLALTFNHDGNLLAVGGEDGTLRIYKWPSMETALDEFSGHSSVKDLDFSPDGKFLVSVGSGPGRIWNVALSTSDEVFGFCRFSRGTDAEQVLYVTAMRDKGGNILKWNTTSWTRMASKHVVGDPVCAFNVSPDGKLLAIGTIQGDILILSSGSMQVQTVVKKAHLGLVTALAFSNDSRALISASLDSSARVTLIKDKKKKDLETLLEA